MEATLIGLPLPLRFLPPEPMTDEEIMAFSRANKGFPVERDEEGYLIVMSPTGQEGSEKNAEIVFELILWNKQAGHGVVTESNGGYTLSDTSMRAPDAAWTVAERLAHVTTAERKRFSKVCPDFIIEVRSPSDPLQDLQRKMQIWIRNGVKLAWLVDPEEHVVTIYRPDREPEYLDNISQIAGEGPVAGFVLPLNSIFT